MLFAPDGHLKCSLEMKAFSTVDKMSPVVLHLAQLQMRL